MLRLILFFLITLNFSCKNDLNSIIDINKFSRSPAAITENFVLKYTDSALTRAILDSPLNVDYTNQKFPYSEFPDGLNIKFYDCFFILSYFSSKC